MTGGAAPQSAPPRQLLLQADQVIYDATKGVVTAQGHVEISSDDRTLIADQVTYNENTDVVMASGNVSIQNAAGDVAYANSVELTRDYREGALQGFSALLGQRGRIAANSAERREGRFTITNGAVYTPCELCAEDGDQTPTWEIRAARVVHDELEKKVYFEDASVEFLGVPVLWLPIFSQADPTVRYQNGFLLPDIGDTGLLGPFLKLPYYYNFSDSADLTLAPFLTVTAGESLQGEFRERFASGGGLWIQPSLTFDQRAHDQPGEDTWMSGLFGQGWLPLSDDWRVGFDAQLSSNRTYLHRYNISDTDRLTNDVYSDVVDGRSRGEIISYYFQSLRASDFQSEIPLVLPSLSYTYIPEDRIWGGRLKVDASTLYLNRGSGTDVFRGSSDVDWLFPYTTSDGQVLSAEGFARGDAYYVQDALADTPTAPSNSETIGRGLAYAMLEWRWPFARDLSGGFFPDETDLVVEPIAQLITATNGGNPRGLPNEDSIAYSLSATNLFEPNPSPGLDLWTGGTRATFGLRSTALMAGGQVTGMLGEQYRFTTQPGLPPALQLDNNASNVVGRITADFANFELTHQFSFDPNKGTIQQNELYVTARFGLSNIQLSYVKLPPGVADPTLGQQEQINLNATVILYRNWGVFGVAQRDLANGKMLEAGFGVTYDNDCFVAALGFNRRYTSILDLPPSSSIVFHIGLKTGAGGTIH
ncbi:MAG TPA: LPS assembly protein LptD [Micropepsaceae bacterium]|nr:LPS assembly protein LptD [Micropepsaceae bacterium]